MTPGTTATGTTATDTTHEVFAKLADIIEEIAEVPAADISPDKRFIDDLDIDSLSMIEIAAQTEAAFELDIPPEDLADLLTVGDAVDLVQRKRA